MGARGYLVEWLPFPLLARHDANVGVGHSLAIVFASRRSRDEDRSRRLALDE